MPLWLRLPAEVVAAAPWSGSAANCSDASSGPLGALLSTAESGAQLALPLFTSLRQAWYDLLLAGASSLAAAASNGTLTVEPSRVAISDLRQCPANVESDGSAVFAQAHNDSLNQGDVVIGGTTAIAGAEAASGSVRIRTRRRRLQREGDSRFLQAADARSGDTGSGIDWLSIGLGLYLDGHELLGDGVDDLSGEGTQAVIADVAARLVWAIGNLSALDPTLAPRAFNASYQLLWQAVAHSSSILTMPTAGATTAVYDVAGHLLLQLSLWSVGLPSLRPTPPPPPPPDQTPIIIGAVIGSVAGAALCACCLCVATLAFRRHRRNAEARRKLTAMKPPALSVTSGDAAAAPAKRQQPSSARRSTWLGLTSHRVTSWASGAAGKMLWWRKGDKAQKQQQQQHQPPAQLPPEFFGLQDQSQTMPESLHTHRSNASSSSTAGEEGGAAAQSARRPSRRGSSSSSSSAAAGSGGSPSTPGRQYRSPNAPEGGRGGGGGAAAIPRSARRRPSVGTTPSPWGGSGTARYASILASATDEASGPASVVAAAVAAGGNAGGVTSVAGGVGGGSSSMMQAFRFYHSAAQSARRASIRPATTGGGGGTMPAAVLHQQQMSRSTRRRGSSSIGSSSFASHGMVSPSYGRKGAAAAAGSFQYQRSLRHMPAGDGSVPAADTGSLDPVRVEQLLAKTAAAVAIGGSGGGKPALPFSSHRFLAGATHRSGAQSGVDDKHNDANGASAAQRSPQPTSPAVVGGPRPPPRGRPAQQRDKVNEYL